MPLEGQSLGEKEFLELLLEERNHHFHHPYEVGSRFALSLSANCFAVLIAVVLGDFKVADADALDMPFFTSGIIVLIGGVALAGWGLSEHTSYHALQRRRIEDAIENLLQNGASVEATIDRYGYREIGGVSIPLFIAEPDRRIRRFYHDTKIEIGLVLQLTSIALVVVAL